MLLDSHTFLWWCDGDAQLSRKARTAIEEQACFVSIASFWELAIKVSIEKLRLPDSIDRYFPEQMLLNGFDQRAIDFGDIARCATLPFHHRDPFDRMLVAQALEGALPIVSRDPVFSRYGVKRIW